MHVPLINESELKVKVHEMAELCKQLPPDHDMGFLCPDGFYDSIEPKYLIGPSDVQFLSYIHRERFQQVYVDIEAVRKGAKPNEK